jgi:hypothetical protein
MDLFDELKTILARLESEGVEYALCGGLAMAVYAFPRSTLDIDLMIDQADMNKVKAIAQDLGFTFDAGLMQFSNGDVQIYRVTKIDQETREPLVLDLLLVTEKLKDVWSSRTKVAWEQGDLSVVSPEGLIKLKSLRKSGQDEDDIKQLRSIIDEA